MTDDAATEQEGTRQPSGHYADHQPRPVGPRRTWGTRPEGPGRYVVLEHPLGRPAGVLWTNDADAIGFLNYGTHDEASDLHMELVMGIQAAYRTEGSTPTIVFDHWADRATLSVLARDVGATADLNAVMEYALDHNDTPPTE